MDTGTIHNDRILHVATFVRSWYDNTGISAAICENVTAVSISCCVPWHKALFLLVCNYVKDKMFATKTPVSYSYVKVLWGILNKVNIPWIT